MNWTELGEGGGGVFECFKFSRMLAVACVLCVQTLLCLRLFAITSVSYHCNSCVQAYVTTNIVVSTGCVQSCVSMLTVVGVNRLCSKTHWMSTLSIACWWSSERTLMDRMWPATLATSTPLSWWGDCECRCTIINTVIINHKSCYCPRCRKQFSELAYSKS